MSWQKLLSNASHPGLGYTVLGVIFLTFLLLLLSKRSEVRGILALAGLFGLCLAALLGSGALAALGHETAAVYVRGVAIFCEGLCLIRIMGVAIFRVVLPAVRFYSPRILQEVLVAVAYIVWALFWLRANGMDPTSVFATSAILTAVIGFSLQDTLGNILAGIAIEIDKSVQVGDWIKVGDQTGKVVEITWRQTSLETRNWETVVIPNSVLAKNQFVVLGRREGQPVQWRRWVWFNVDFRYSPTHVMDTVNKAVRSAEIAHVAKNPEPNCVLMDFSESTGRYAARYWLTDLAADDPTDSEIRAHIYYALKRANIPLSIPAQAVFVTEETSERKAKKEERSIAHRLEALSHVELLYHLTLEERHKTAERLVPAPFAKGDVITRQGDEAHWLYILMDGQVDVIVNNEKGQLRRVAELGPGNFFGEMGLMTGEPRSATVVARTEVDCYRLDRETFREILHARPALADGLSHLIAKRQMELRSVLEDLDTQTRAAELSSAHQDILGKIRHFFGLEG